MTKFYASKSAAFTLLEIIIALAVVSICAVIGGGYWDHRKYQQQLEHHSAQVMAYLVRVQRTANWQNSTWQIQFTPEATHWLFLAFATVENNVIEHKGLRLKLLSEDISHIEYNKSAPIIFYGRRAMASPGTIQLINKIGQVNVIVSTRGRIRRCWQPLAEMVNEQPNQAMLLGISPC